MSIEDEAEVHPVDDHALGDGLGEAEAPPGNPNCVAVTIRGDSMHPIANGSILYYDRDTIQNPRELLGKMCVVRVKDGPTLVKILRQGTKKNRWTLESWNAPPRENVILEWVSEVLFIQPN